MGISGPIKRSNCFRRVFRTREPSFLFSCFHPLFEFVYPPICTLCEIRHDGGDPICDLCMDQLINSLSIKSQSGPAEFHQLSGALYFDWAVTCWDFTSEIENLIHQVKYQGRKKLGRYLGKLAGAAVSDHFREFVKDAVWIPVPLHCVRQREREFNQSEWIARGLAEPFHGVLQPKTLERRKHTRTQTTLSAPEREKNVMDAFRVRNPDSVRGRSTILVDDVITTGATLNACAGALKEAGAESVVGFALARPR